MSEVNEETKQKESLVELKEKEEIKEIDQVKIENMDRETEKTKKCCAIMKDDVHICFMCCTYSWCATLNGIECCCKGLSACCLGMSAAALFCNKALEQIDCDNH